MNEIFDLLKNKKEDIKKIVNCFGARPQKIKSIEELSELIQAISRDVNGLDNNVSEEMADCFIMLAQLIDIFNNKDEVSFIVNQKLSRTIKIIEARNE